jgi:hypothetical protein
MASNEECWIGDIVNDFIHSSIWLSPIQTYIDTNCACFDYDDDIQPSTLLLHEQKIIYQKYQNLVNSLITCLSNDLKLDLNQLKNYCQNNNSIAINDSYEQLYSAYDCNLFTEMMKRKNLILQLQALVNLQVECGLLKQTTETTNDQVLQLLLQATTPAKKIEISNQSKTTIDAVPEEILRDKLRELSLVDEGNTSAISARENFLKQQRDLIINKQRNERVRELEKETKNTRPQSAAKMARKAMETSNEQISKDELEKRRAIAAKLRREVVDKR